MVEIRKPFEAAIKIHPRESEEQITEQSAIEYTDINRLISKYDTPVDQLMHNRAELAYGEQSNKTLHHILNDINELTGSIHDLPAEVREQVGDTPEKIVEYIENPLNKSALEELGILNKSAPDPAPQPEAISENQAPPDA